MSKKPYRFPVSPGCRKADTCAPCPNCKASTPSGYIVSFAGIVAGSCGTCSDFNGPFVLAFLDPANEGGACIWAHTFTACGKTWTISLTVGGPTIKLQLQQGNPVVSDVTFEYSAAAGPYDCNNLPALTFFSQSAAPCDFSAAVPTISTTNAPGACKPCCADNCGILYDAFTRADGPPGSNWSVQSGSWAIAGNKLTTSSASAILLGVPPAPAQAPADLYISAAIEGKTGDVFSLYLAWQDATHNLRADFTVGVSGKIQLFENGSKVAEVDCLVNSPTWIFACWNYQGDFCAGLGSTDYIHHNPGTGFGACASAGNASATGYGIGATPAAGDTAKFLTVSAVKEGFPCPTCGLSTAVCDCCSDPPLLEYDVDLGNSPPATGDNCSNDPVGGGDLGGLLPCCGEVQGVVTVQMVQDVIAPSCPIWCYGGPISSYQCSFDHPPAACNVGTHDCGLTVKLEVSGVNGVCTWQVWVKVCHWYPPGPGSPADAVCLDTLVGPICDLAGNPSAAARGESGAVYQAAKGGVPGVNPNTCALPYPVTLTKVATIQTDYFACGAMPATITLSAP